MGALRRIERLPARPVGLMVLGAAMAVAAGLSLWWLRETTFTIDELGYLVGRRGWDGTTLLEPHNGHLIVTHLIVFKSVLEIFGAESHLPFTVLTVAGQVAVGGMTYELSRRRIGPLAALIPAVLVLFFGAGWEMMLNPAGLGAELGLVAGMGALLCLERDDRRGDAWACVLLTAAFGSHTLALAFAVGVIVEILLLGGTAAWRRLWLVALPLALYGAWAIWATQFDQVETGAYAIASLPSGSFDLLAAICASVVGIFRHPGSPDLVTQLVTVVGARGQALVLVLIAAVVVRARTAPPPAARTWSLLALLTAYLVLIGLGLRDGRPPEASRYVYAGGVFLVLLGAQLCDGLRIGRGWALAAAAVLLVSLLGNVAQMKDAGLFFRIESEYNRAEMAALELARGCAPPDYMAETEVTTILPHRDMYFTAEEYYETVDAYGSPAFRPEALVAAGPEARAAAEQVLAETLGREVTLATTPIPELDRLCRPASAPTRR